MTATNRTIEKFITHHGITFSCVPIDRNPNMDDMGPGARHWNCWLEREGTRMKVPFSQGSAYYNPPTAAEVLDCVASDAAGFENANGFEDWCSEYGYDTDSRKADRIYNTIEEQRDELERFLGREAFEKLLWSVERL